VSTVNDPVMSEVVGAGVLAATGVFARTEREQQQFRLHLRGIRHSPTAFLRLPSCAPQRTDVGLVAFNRHYVEQLAAWRIFRDEVNPVARSNAHHTIVLRLQLHRAERKPHDA
jgi:hypothetical protein